MSGTVIDIFAGPRGWSEGLRELGLTDVGIEWDEWACKTAVAAGHPTIQADVSRYPTERMRGNVAGLIGSPPCPTFSAAGNGSGKHVMAILAAGLRDTMHGRNIVARCRTDATRVLRPIAPSKRAVKNKRPGLPHHTISVTRAERSAWARRQAFMSCLVLEVARFARDIHPEWIACEQVPAVLPLWRVLAHELRAQGYSAWTGVLNAADYGVPQTRQRAFLIANRTRQVTAPAPSHCRGGSEADLFGRELLPWVSMADALGWGAMERPVPTVTAAHDRFAKGGRQAIERERERGSWVARIPTAQGTRHD